MGRQRAERLFSSFLSAQPDLRGGRGCWSARGWRRSWPPASPTRSGPTPPAGCATTRGPCSACTGVTLVDADRLAIAILPGADRQDIRRGRAIVAQTLRTATRDGHTMLPAELVVAALRAEGIGDPAAAVAAAVESGDVLEHEPRGAGVGRARATRPSPTRRCGRCRWPATGWPRRRWPRTWPRLAATAERIADPASVRSVAKGRTMSSRRSMETGNSWKVSFRQSTAMSKTRRSRKSTIGALARSRSSFAIPF